MTLKPQRSFRIPVVTRYTEGKELSQDEWEWPYDNTMKNKPATLEDYKQQLTKMFIYYE